jgi:hypothetical protein
MKILITKEQELMQPLDFAALFGYKLEKRNIEMLECILQDASAEVESDSTNFDNDMECYAAYIGGSFECGNFK